MYIKHKSITLLLAFLSTVMLFSSCEKTEKIQPAGLWTDIDGVEWKANSVFGNMENNKIVFGGKNVSGETLTISLNEFKTGTFVVKKNSESFAKFSLTGKGSLFYTTRNYRFAGGKVVITEIDKKNFTISGTFEFKVHLNVNKDTKIFTEGEFNRLRFDVPEYFEFEEETGTETEETKELNYTEKMNN